MACTIAVSNFTKCLRVKESKFTRISVNNFCLEYGVILIYCHPQDTTTNCVEQTMVPCLGVNGYLICIHTK